MILPESPDKSVDTEHVYDGAADPIVVEGTKEDWANLYRKAVENYPDGSYSSEKVEEIQPGHLYDILYHGVREMGFFCRFEGTKAVFFCFNFDCQGDYLFYPSDEITVVDHPDQNLAALARTIYFECNKIGWLVEHMKWDNDAGFVVERARRG